MDIHGRWLVTTAVLVLVAACDATPGAEPLVDITSGGDTTPEEVMFESIDCPSPSGIPLREDDSVVLEEIAVEDDVRVFAAEYPLPGPTEGLWSQWGQGVVGPHGLHVSGVGDHEGADGNSYIFEYDPESRRLTRVMDILSLVDHQPGAWGYGKIHAQMVTDMCSSVWMFSYWGTRRDLVYGDGYEGDLLLRFDTGSRTVTNYGPVAGRRGIPSLVAADDGRYLVAEAVDPFSRDGDLVVFDTQEEEVIQVVDDPDHDGFRALAEDAHGRVIYSITEARTMILDPATGETEPAKFEWPAGGDNTLRAATRLTPDGRFFGVLSDDRILFSVDAEGTLEVLADADGYTTSLAMTPDGSRIYWLPRAHGHAWEDGAVVRVLDTATGEVGEVVGLREPFERELGLLPGGTYSITYHQDRLILGVNASPLDDDSGFGTVVLTVIEGV
jgi:hypothetical protein